MPTETRGGDELATRRGGRRKPSSRKPNARRNGAGKHADAEARVRNAVGEGDPPAAAAAAGDEVPELEGQAQLELPIDTGPLTSTVGSTKPTSSTFKLRSLSLPLAGQAPLDSKLWLLVEADADDVGVQSHRKGRTVTGRVRHHTFTPLSARVLTVDELAELGVEL